MISNYVPLFIAWGVVGWYKLNILMSDTIIKGTTLLIVIFKMQKLRLKKKEEIQGQSGTVGQSI